MAFRFDYFPDCALILIRVQGDVSIEENREIGLQIVATLEQVETSADILFDLREIGRFPTSLGELRKTSAIIRSPRLGWMVLLTGDRPILRFIATALIQLQTRSARMRVFDTLESAIRFLKALQPSDRVRANGLDDLYQAVK
jgi:hypothetical protein